MNTREPRRKGGTSYVLLWNVKTEIVLQLATGVSIRPLSSPITTFDLAATGAAGFPEWSVLVPMEAGLCAEIESIGTKATAPGYDGQNRGWLAYCLLVLRGCGAGLPVAMSFLSWNRVAGCAAEKRAPLQPTDTTLLEDFRVSFKMTASSSDVLVTPEIAAWVREHFEGFNVLAAASAAFRFALEACFDWRYSHDGRAAIARLWAGIEALFGINAELSHRLALSAASLLAARGAARICYYKKVKGLYAQRSRAVHGAAMEESEIGETLDGSFVLLRDLLSYAASIGRTPTDEDILEAIMG